MWFVKRPLRSVKGPIRKKHELFMKTGYSTVSEHMEWQWVFWQCDDSHYHKQKWIEARFFSLSLILLNQNASSCSWGNRKHWTFKKFKPFPSVLLLIVSPDISSRESNFQTSFTILEHVSIKVLVFRVNQCSIGIQCL